ncbi:hypothetical protein AA3250_1265 [Gluconobacter albidus NBRC 3250]|nr:hypothetical protein AA3250_1265 [Gluconobacter albidus NBRC 3250]
MANAEYAPKARAIPEKRVLVSIRLGDSDGREKESCRKNNPVPSERMTERSGLNRASVIAVRLLRRTIIEIQTRFRDFEYFL